MLLATGLKPNNHLISKICKLGQIMRCTISVVWNMYSLETPPAMLCVLYLQVAVSEQLMLETQQAHTNRAFAFGGKDTMQVLALIEENIGRFRNKPIGPLGREIELLDPK